MRLVTGALSPALVASLRATVVWLYEALDSARLARSTELKRYLYRTYDGWDGLQLDTVRNLLARDEALEAAIDTAAAIVPNLTFQPEVSFFRRSGRAESVVRWHCDAEAVGTARFEDCVNAWLPLDPVGDGSFPSLEVLVDSNRTMAEAAPPPDNAWYRDDEWVASVPGYRLVPQLVPGDLFLFDHLTLHRTEVLPERRPRLSCELRFAT